MARSHNFSAGPTALPLEVLRQAHEEFFDFAGTGMSVMEISHRSEVFMELAYQAEQDLRAILQVPSQYKVLFVQGGTSLQFAQVPMNLLGDKRDCGLSAYRALVGQGHPGCSALLRRSYRCQQQGFWL
jgi:phosphoserine aminotransferase